MALEAVALPLPALLVGPRYLPAVVAAVHLDKQCPLATAELQGLIDLGSFRLQHRRSISSASGEVQTTPGL